ncbi:outer membrane protein transport protein [bacterium]|nr:outer membrane protein transport protein [candidate division CSSED10-310 bacterium]
MTCIKCKMILTIFILTLPANAQYFHANYSSSRSTALGGVFAAGFNDASATILNPAVLPKVERSQIMFDSNVSQSEISLYPDNSYSDIESEANPTLAPYIGFVWNMNSRLAGFGASISTSDRYHMKFNSGGMQRYQLKELDFNAISFDVAIGYIPVRDLSIGVRLGYRIGLSEISFYRNPFGNEPSSPREFDINWKYKFEDFSGFNSVLGLIWSPSYRFDIGLTYQPPLAYHYSTSLTVNLPEILGENEFRRSVEDLRITVPQEACMGLHWIATERIDFYFDIAWSQFSQMDPMELKVDKPVFPQIPESFEIPIDFNDCWHVHTGLEIITSELITLRFGTFYMSDFIDNQNESLILAGGSRTGITAGLGMNISRIKIDLSSGYTIMRKHQITGANLPISLQGDLESNQKFIQLGISWLL